MTVNQHLSVLVQELDRLLDFEDTFFGSLYLKFFFKEGHALSREQKLRNLHQQLWQSPWVAVREFSFTQKIHQPEKIQQIILTCQDCKKFCYFSIFSFLHRLFFPPIDRAFLIVRQIEFNFHIRRYIAINHETQTFMSGLDFLIKEASKIIQDLDEVNDFVWFQSVFQLENPKQNDHGQLYKFLSELKKINFFDINSVLSSFVLYWSFLCYCEHLIQKGQKNKDQQRDLILLHEVLTQMEPLEFKHQSYQALKERITQMLIDVKFEIGQLDQKNLYQCITAYNAIHKRNTFIPSSTIKLNAGEEKSPSKKKRTSFLGLFSTRSVT